MNDRAKIYADQAMFNAPYVFENKALFEYLDENGFFTAPASRQNHGSYAGGLFDHSLNVFKRLRTLTEQCGLTWRRPESPFIVGMFHDLCKIDMYKLIKGQTKIIPDPLGFNDFVEYTTDPHYEHNENVTLTGHGEKSVLLLSQFMTLTEEEMLCIRYHMGAYMTDEWGAFDAAIRKYQNVLYTHMADMLASKVDEVK